LPEPERIVAHCGEVLTRTGTLSGRTVLITAGATREPFDPFRFISNPSTGKMGYAVAAEAQRRGARVILVSAHAEVAPPSGVETVAVGTTAEMLAACETRAPEADIIIGAAAASDFRPAEYSPQKIKKSEAALTVQLERTPDVLATIGAAKREDQVLVAFSAETADLEQNARAKLTRKHADLIIANDISRPGAGFAVDTNIATLLWADGRREELAQMSKQEMAGIIVDQAAALLAARKPGR
jgi:phosphopantothenoylcysteine decarboxylase/phosphopantothenate--cysteine ligase